MMMYPLTLVILWLPRFIWRLMEICSDGQLTQRDYEFRLLQLTLGICYFIIFQFQKDSFIFLHKTEKNPQIPGVINACKYFDIFDDFSK